jgi:hypothetical protein
MWESLAAVVEALLCAETNEAVEEETLRLDYEAKVASLVRSAVYTYADARTRFIRSRIEAGEQCGILAA